MIDQTSIEQQLQKKDDHLKFLQTITKISEYHRDSNLFELLQEIVNILPQSSVHQEITGIKIQYGDFICTTEGYTLSQHHQRADISLADDTGYIEISYNVESKQNFEEKELINSIAQSLSAIIKNKELEEKLKDSENKYRTLVENSPNYIVTVNRAGIIQFINQESEHGKGNELIGSSVYSDLRADSIDEYKITLDKTFSTKKKYEAEIINRFGTYSLCYFVPLIVEDKVIEVMVIGVDLNSLKHVNKKLQESEQKYRDLIETARGLIFQSDTDGCFVYLTPAWEQKLGYEIKEMLGKKFNDFKKLEVIDKDMNTFKNLLNGQKVEDYQTIYLSKAGKEVHLIFNVIPRKNKNGVIVGTQGTAYDISALKQVEQKLKESEARYRIMFDAVPVGVIISQNGFITYVNPTLAEIHGYSNSKELIGKHVSKLYSPEMRFDAISLGFQKQFRENQLESYQTLGIRKNGSKFPLQIKVTDIDLPQGPAILAFFEDLTDMKRAEESKIRFQTAIQQSQKLESLGILAGGIAHDFNNFLMGIVGNTSILLDELPSHSPYLELVQEIDLISIKASALTGQMLAYSGKGKYELEVLDVSTLIKKMYHLLRVSMNKSIELKFNLSEKPIIVEIDETQFQQILLNLIINSSEAIGSNQGLIKISTSKLQVDGEYIINHILDREIEEGEYACIEVEDNGKGIKKEIIKLIFDPFYSTKFIGRGLGLSVVYGIVTTLIGTIEVVSQENVGTKMRILLPITTKSIITKNFVKVDKPILQKKGLVLVCDDEENVRKVAGRMIRKMGYEVLLASNGREAVELVIKNPQINVILLDLTMPIMGGREAVTEIKKVNEKVPIIITSGYSGEEIDGIKEVESIAAFIQKPYKISDLSHLIDQVALN